MEKRLYVKKYIHEYQSKAVSLPMIKARKLNKRLKNKSSNVKFKKYNLFSFEGDWWFCINAYMWE